MKVNANSTIQEIHQDRVWAAFDKRVFTQQSFVAIGQQLEALILKAKPIKVDKKLSLYHLQQWEPSLVVKYYPLRSWLLQPIKYRFKMTRAMRSWRYGQLLADAGVSVIPIWGIWQHMHWLGPLQGFILMPFQAGVTLDVFIATQKNHVTRLENVVEQIVSMYLKLCRMHMSHGDFKAKNFIVDDNDKVYLLDLDAVTLHKNRRFEKAAQTKDWARLIRNFAKDPRVIKCFEDTLRRLIQNK